ncbi:MAG TPA: M14 family zinc carboxypeptidase [Gemmatimonadaceae bacterium]
MRRSTLLLALALQAAPALAAAQRTPADSVRDDANFSFYDRGPYRPGVPRPDSVLGYAIGDLHTQHALQQRALMAIADAARDRVVVEEIGTTNERRPMRLFVVSAPENIARLDAIRADLDRIADPRGASQAELDAAVARTPAVVWFSMSVHGDEVPGFEAAMPLLYQLAASEEPATLAALRDAIVVINPSSNPDGHERFTVWSNSIAVGSPEDAALEQQRNQPWSVSGRFNHYRFDMNRDVFATTQREVRALVAAMLRWHPMVTADEHGYTTQYYMAPPAQPINEHLGAESAKWFEIVGRANAAAFDARGWGYYVRDVFDAFYPGYWDVWPALTGATGMTYETDGGPALLKRRDDGTLLSLRDGIAKHYVASLATLEGTTSRGRERVRDYLAFRQGAVAANRTSPLKRVVWVPGRDPRRAAELAGMLLRQGIEVRRTAAPFTASRAHAYADGRTGSRRFEAGAYVVDLAQPQGRLARALLEPDATLDAAFARTQRERFWRNALRGRRESTEGYEFYDITSWSLPVALGIEGWWTEDAGAVGEPLAVPATDAVPFGPLTGPRLEGETLPVDVPGGIVSGRGSTVAYVFGPERTSATALAFHLLHRGYNVAVATQPIDAGGRTWARGAYVVRVGRNDTTLAGRLDSLARAADVEVVGLASGYPAAGQFGIGSESTISLVRPRIAVVADEGVSQTAYGALWWSLERRFGIPFTPVTWRGVSGGLEGHNVLVLPDASPGAIQARLGSAGLEALKTWISNGGTLVTMGGATTWAARESVGLTTSRALGADTAAAAGAADSVRSTPARDSALATLTGVPSPTADRDRPVFVPGAMFDVALDRVHWLTLGLDQPRLTVMLEGSTFLKPSREGSNVAVFAPTGTLHRAGFVWPDNTERLLRGTSYLVEEPTGSGHVVLFNGDPMFRGWWRALDRLVLNAAVLGPTM